MTEEIITFRRAYCERFECPDAEFDSHLFWRTLYRRSLPWARLIWMFNRDFFRRDLRTIQQLGICASAREFRSELKGFDYENKSNRGFIRCSCRVRISIKRLLAIEREVNAWNGQDVESHRQYPSERSSSAAAP